MSGIQIDDECKCVFDDMKIFKKGGCKRRKVSAFTINDGKNNVEIPISKIFFYMDFLISPFQ